MKTHTIIGLIIMTLMLLAPLIFVINNIQFIGSKDEIITRIESGDNIPLKITINVKDGVIAIKNNATIKGWQVKVKYKESDKSLEIQFTNGELTVNLDKGTITIDYKVTKEIQINILNGIITVITASDEINLHGYMLNGKAHFIFLESNTTVNFKLSNGELSVNSVRSKLNGSIQVANGYIDAILQSPNGGTIEYTIDNGEALIFAPNFNTTTTKTENGETGTLYRKGNSLNLNIHITNGGLSLVVTILEATEVKT